MPFAPFPTPDDILAAGRLSHIPLPLSGATLDSGNIGSKLENGIIKLGYGEVYNSTPNYNDELSLYESRQVCVFFTSPKDMSIGEKVKVYVPVYKIGNPTAAVTYNIYGQVEGYPSGSKASDVTPAISNYSETQYSGIWVEFTLDENLAEGLTYYVRGIAAEGGDASNYLGWSILTSGGTNNVQYHDGTQWVDVSAYQAGVIVYYDDMATSGTATFRATPAQLGQWKQLITYVKLNTNNSATYTIKDTSGNTITGPTALSNGLNTIDISSLVSAELYKEIDVVVTLSRVSASDISPELHYAAMLVEGSISIIKSIQRGITSLGYGEGVTSKNVTISPVDIAKTMVSFCGSTVSDDYVKDMTKIFLTDSTTLTVSKGANSTSGYCSWEVIEYV